MTPDPKPTEALKPTPPEGFHIIPADWFDEHTICPSDMLYWAAKRGVWLNSDYQGSRYEGTTDIYCTAEQLDNRNTRATDRDAELAAMRGALEEMVRNGQKQGWNDNYPSSMARANAALASTAGTELLERLRLAVEERDQARIERDTEQQFRQRSDAKLAAVTAELEQIKKSK